MNRQRNFLVAVGAGWLLFSSLPALATTITDTTRFDVNSVVPDNDPKGVVDERTLTSAVQSLSGLQVTLQIAGGYNGDLVVCLTRGSQTVVLVNRPGRTSGIEYGYFDSGLDVTFADDAASGDIHNYHAVVNPAGASLTGTWQPDGRDLLAPSIGAGFAPTGAMDTTPRIGSLADFNGMNPNGVWFLYVADLSAVGTPTIINWGLTVSGDPVSVPDRSRTLVLFALALGAMLLGRRQVSFRHRS